MDAGSIGYPSTCADIAVSYPTPPSDGDYTLYLMNDPTKPWTAYCKDMATAPKDYLSLTNVGQDFNFSQYTAGGASPGTNVRTNFTKLRIGTYSGVVLVDISDKTFATSTGSLMHSGGFAVTAMPYAVAADCNSAASGLANIDLTGTPFAVVSAAFVQGGNAAQGTATYDTTGQVVNLTGGGYCGWTMAAPSITNPFNNAGGPQLPLIYP